MSNTRIEIGKNISLNLVQTDKFKTSLISIYYIRHLCRKEVTANALIPLVLRRGTENYPTSMEIQKRFEELYGANFSIDVSKKGEKQSIRFTVETPHENFVSSDTLLDDSLSIVNEIINNPYLENGSFSDKYVSQEKENLKKRIEGRINDKKQYAVDRCIEEMCKNERFSIYKYGYVEDLKDINSENLYLHYKEVLSGSPIEICIVGDFDKKAVLNAIEKNLSFTRGEIQKIPRENIMAEVTTKNMVNENMDVKQGKLTLGYRTNIPYEDKLYEPLLIASDIIGGGPYSKLFVNVREKESLAYYIFAKIYKYKSIMLISSGVEFKNFDKALEIIKAQIEDMKNGKFDEEIVIQSKKSIVTSVNSMKDSNYSLAEFYLSQALTDDKRDIDEVIKSFEKVNKDEIIKASNNLKLDTIYFLRNSNAGIN